MYNRFSLRSLLLSATAVATLSACSLDSETETGEQFSPFSLNFVAQSGGETIDCDAMAMGFGTDGHYAVGVSDLRFYVSNLQFFDQYDAPITINLDDNEFQLNHEQGAVSLIDLTSNTSGTCTADAIEHSEGTARTNHVISGSMLDTGVHRVTFDIGVPQAVMKQVIATQSAEDAPSPLNEMYWSWASGYRHFVMNFAIENMHGNLGEGYIHLGSRGCGSDGLLALENKETCDFVNTPSVELNNFDLVNDQVIINLDDLLANLSFAPAMGGHGSHNADSDMEMMDKPSVTCHSASPEMQPDCGPIFANFGLSTETGSADSANNMVVKF